MMELRVDSGMAGMCPSCRAVVSGLVRISCPGADYVAVI